MFEKRRNNKKSLCNRLKIAPGNNFRFGYSDHSSLDTFNQINKGIDWKYVQKESHWEWEIILGHQPRNPSCHTNWGNKWEKNSRKKHQYFKHYSRRFQNNPFSKIKRLKKFVSCWLWRLMGQHINRFFKKILKSFENGGQEKQ